MSKHLPTTKPAEAKPERRDRRVSSACAAPAAVVERERAVIVSRAGQEGFTRLVRLLGRQAAREDLSPQDDRG
jgi:hypothetical protein